MLIQVHTGKRYSGKTKGLVEVDGVFIGFAAPKRRVASKQYGGGTRVFYTATPPERAYDPCSGGLGTRHPNQLSAVSALIAHHLTTTPSAEQLARVEAVRAYRAAWR